MVEGLGISSLSFYFSLTSSALEDGKYNCYESERDKSNHRLDFPVVKVKSITKRFLFLIKRGMTNAWVQSPLDCDFVNICLSG